MRGGDGDGDVGGDGSWARSRDDGGGGGATPDGRDSKCTHEILAEHLVGLGKPAACALVTEVGSRWVERKTGDYYHFLD